MVLVLFPVLFLDLFLVLFLVLLLVMFLVFFWFRCYSLFPDLTGSRFAQLFFILYRSSLYHLLLHLICMYVLRFYPIPTIRLIPIYYLFPFFSFFSSHRTFIFFHSFLPSAKLYGISDSGLKPDPVFRFIRTKKWHSF